MIAGFAIDALVEGGIATAVACAVLAFVPAKSAATRYAVWFVVLLALIAGPVFAAARPWLHLLPGPPVARVAIFSLTALRPLGADAARWSAWPLALGWMPNAALAAIWIAGASVGLARLAVSFWRIARIRRGAAPLSYVDGVPVLTSRHVNVPIATGIFSPAIVLPDTLARSLAAGDLRCTLEHELAHVRRGDVVTNAVGTVAEALFFWNPWVRLAGRNLCAEREAACDDVAMLRLGESTDYARALAELGRRLTASPGALPIPSAFGSRGGLVARIERLAAGQPADPQINYVAFGGCIVLLALLVSIVPPLSGAPARAAAIPAQRATVAAASCKSPNQDVKALVPAPPELPKSQWPPHAVTALVRVTVSAGGKATAATVYRSSGDAAVDRAVLRAAEHSTYSPKLVNCTAVESTYLFKAQFGAP